MDEYISGTSQTKLEAAKLSAVNLVQSSGNEFALMIYDDCDSYGDPYSGSIRVLQDFTTDDSALVQNINSISALSSTPIADSITEGQTYISQKGKGDMIVVLTDGEETCGYDIDVLSAIQSASNSGIAVSVIGFQLDDYSSQTLQDTVNSGGGNYYTADDADELTQVFKDVTDDECFCVSFILLLVPLLAVVVPKFII